MRYALAAVALILTALGFTATASAKRLPYHTVPSFVQVSPDRENLWVTPVGHSQQHYRIPAKPNERWFQVASKTGKPGFVQYWVTPGGSPMVPDTSNMVADITGQQTAPMRYDNFGSLYVTVSGSGATVNMPFAGNADAQTATSAGQAVGLMIFNGTSWDRVQGTSGSMNVTVTNPTSSNPTQNIEYDSGVCFQAVSSDPVCGTGPSSAHGCATGPVLPCYWDVSKTFGGSLAGKTLYGVVFHSGQTMTTLAVQLTCVDNSSYVGANATPPLFGDMTNGSSMGGEQYIAVGGNGGRKIVTGLFCELFAIGGNTTALSATALQQVGFLIR